MPRTTLTDEEIRAFVEEAVAAYAAEMAASVRALDAKLELVFDELPTPEAKVAFVNLVLLALAREARAMNRVAPGRWICDERVH